MGRRPPKKKSYVASSAAIWKPLSRTRQPRAVYKDRLPKRSFMNQRSKQAKNLHTTFTFTRKRKNHSESLSLFSRFFFFFFTTTVTRNFLHRSKRRKFAAAIELKSKISIERRLLDRLRGVYSAVVGHVVARWSIRFLRHRESVLLGLWSITQRGNYVLSTAQRWKRKFGRSCLLVLFYLSGS